MTTEIINKLIYQLDKINSIQNLKYKSNKNSKGYIFPLGTNIDLMFSRVIDTLKASRSTNSYESNNNKKF